MRKGNAYGLISSVPGLPRFFPRLTVLLEAVVTDRTNRYTTGEVAPKRLVPAAVPHFADCLFPYITEDNTPLPITAADHHVTVPDDPCLFEPVAVLSAPP